MMPWQNRAIISPLQVQRHRGFVFDAQYGRAGLHSGEPGWGAHFGRIIRVQFFDEQILIV